MRVRVHNGYWEYDTVYTDVIKIEDKHYTFILYEKGGFSKEFDNGIYSYTVED